MPISDKFRHLFLKVILPFPDCVKNWVNDIVPKMIISDFEHRYAHNVRGLTSVGGDPYSNIIIFVENPTRNVASGWTCA